ncbi:hypothetical protein H0I76_07665 [Limibaculum sp. M0105]|uniref:GIY-YIG domain-containing protein n=1 Tax=Thermohalobaculum xanthum TaxID=2753746 RepID=A0A8J7SBN7_9RHOB|nr:hypothetical protein [Thermohalobaculum xanthum]MBK0399062.1 hypothetical protein [Thermohalobaculum xanthum]
MTDRLEDLRRFYALMDELERRVGGKRILAECHGRLSWPERGVYFFFEEGEDRSGSGRGPRVVRVGTHALKAGSGTTLWKRLSQHRGQARSGGGNHRGSIFRLIVGTALMARDGHVSPNWDNRHSSASREVRGAELTMERAVSVVIGAMPFLWLPVEDDAGPQSGRGIIERGSIALLSDWGKEPIDPPSDRWLGHHCNRPRVRGSGLWNSNHVDESYEVSYLDALERYIQNAGA